MLTNYNREMVDLYVNKLKRQGKGYRDVYVGRSSSKLITTLVHLRLYGMSWEEIENSIK